MFIFYIYKAASFFASSANLSLSDCGARTSIVDPYVRSCWRRHSKGPRTSTHVSILRRSMACSAAMICMPSLSACGSRPIKMPNTCGHFRCITRRANPNLVFSNGMWLRPSISFSSSARTDLLSKSLHRSRFGKSLPMRRGNFPSCICDI